MIQRPFGIVIRVCMGLGFFWAISAWGDISHLKHNRYAHFVPAWGFGESRIEPDAPEDQPVVLTTFSWFFDLDTTIQPPQLFKINRFHIVNEKKSYGYYPKGEEYSDLISAGGRLWLFVRTDTQWRLYQTSLRTHSAQWLPARSESFQHLRGFLLNRNADPAVILKKDESWFIRDGQILGGGKRIQWNPAQKITEVEARSMRSASSTMRHLPNLLGEFDTGKTAILLSFSRILERKKDIQVRYRISKGSDQPYSAWSKPFWDNTIQLNERGQYFQYWISYTQRGNAYRYVPELTLNYTFDEEKKPQQRFVFHPQGSGGGSGLGLGGVLINGVMLTSKGAINGKSGSVLTNESSTGNAGNTMPSGTRQNSASTKEKQSDPNNQKEENAQSQSSQEISKQNEDSAAPKHDPENVNPKKEPPSAKPSSQNEPSSGSPSKPDDQKKNDSPESQNKPDIKRVSEPQPEKKGASQNDPGSQPESEPSPHSHAPVSQSDSEPGQSSQPSRNNGHSANEKSKASQAPSSDSSSNGQDGNTQASSDPQSHSHPSGQDSSENKNPSHEGKSPGPGKGEGKPDSTSELGENQKEHENKNALSDSSKVNNQEESQALQKPAPQASGHGDHTGGSPDSANQLQGEDDRESQHSQDMKNTNPPASASDQDDQAAPEGNSGLGNGMSPGKTKDPQGYGKRTGEKVFGGNPSGADGVSPMKMTPKGGFIAGGGASRTSGAGSGVHSQVRLATVEQRELVANLLTPLTETEKEEGSSFPWWIVLLIGGAGGIASKRYLWNRTTAARDGTKRESTPDQQQETLGQWIDEMEHANHGWEHIFHFNKDVIGITYTGHAYMMMNREQRIGRIPVNALLHENGEDAEIPVKKVAQVHHAFNEAQIISRKDRLYLFGKEGQDHNKAVWVKMPAGEKPVKGKKISFPQKMDSLQHFRVNKGSFWALGVGEDGKRITRIPCSKVTGEAWQEERPAGLEKGKVVAMSHGDDLLIAGIPQKDPHHLWVYQKDEHIQGKWNAIAKTLCMNENALLHATPKRCVIVEPSANGQSITLHLFPRDEKGHFAARASNTVALPYRCDIQSIDIIEGQLILQGKKRSIQADHDYTILYSARLGELMKEDKPMAA